MARALFYEFHTDKEVAGIDRQFLLGPALLVSPVLTKVCRLLDPRWRQDLLSWLANSLRYLAPPMRMLSE